ncbi:MAG: hypothetical protein ACRD2P_12210 [Terriglobia bacterium]
MGNPLTGGGNGEGGGPPPDIPVANFATQAAQTTAGMKAAGWFAKLVAALATWMMPALTTYITALLSVLDSVMALGTNLLTSSQGMNSPGFFQLTAAMIEDLLGVPVDSASMESAFRRGGNIAGMRDVGGKLLDVLNSEFVTGNTLSPDQGFAAAKAFLGFVLAFSVREANVSVTTSLIPEEFRILDGIRDYGVDMARNLGLGRLTRLIFQPFIKATVQDPVTWYFNQKYRPALMPALESVRAHIRGAITDDQFKQNMAYWGFADNLVPAFEQEAAVQVFQTGLYNLYKWGQMSEQDVIKNYQRRGMLLADAQIEFNAALWGEADTEINSLLSTLATQREDGFIDAPTFAGNVDLLPIGQKRKDAFKQLVGQRIEVPRTMLSLVEVESAVISGYLAIDDLSSFLQRKGYSPDDAAVLMLQTLAKIETDEAKLAVTQFKYQLAVAKAKKKGEPIPPPPPGVAPIV